MSKFGMLVSSIPDIDSSQCTSSSSTHTEGTHKSLNKSDKGKAKASISSKAKTLKPKKSCKSSASRPSVSGTKNVFQSPTPRLEVDLTFKNKENNSIPPISDAKGILGSGPTP